ncbi:MAG: hypothetical protein A2V66_14585 [Ignavibacteria bacterium RBG_13_36_8]|nr:MAG: hypothetical protein A2V66_14585 [Ignavibacteria bacterium RBG_13_36_8]
MKNLLKILSLYSALLFTILLATKCVDSVINNQTASPFLQIYSPIAGDTVQVGSNLINYSAYDYSGGQGLAYYDVVINDGLYERFNQNSDGTNPAIYLNIPSTLLGTMIRYYVVAYNLTGSSNVSSVFNNIYVKDKPPGEPHNLMLTKIGTNAVNLLWEDSSDNETGFEVWRKAGANSSYILLQPVLPANTISTNDYNLSPVIDYFYKVRAVNLSGVSGFTNEVSTSSVLGPWNLQSEAIGATAVILKWNDFAVNELGFRIQRTDPYTGTWGLLNIVPANTTEYTDYNVQASTTYIYRVAYYTSTSHSGWSNQTVITTFYTTELPPSNFKAVKYSYGVIKLTWNDTSYLERGTIIERRDNASGGDFMVIHTTVTDETEYYDSGLTAGVKYYYRARYKLGDRIYTEYTDETDATP